MKLTYKKEGVESKLKLKRLQRVNLFLWKFFKSIFTIFLLTYGLFFFVSSRPTPSQEPQKFSPDTLETYTHASIAHDLLLNHKAPSTAIALTSQFITAPETLTRLTYQNNTDQIPVTFEFTNVSPEDLIAQEETLKALGIFSSLEVLSLDEQQFINGRIPAEVFLYSQTIQ